MGEDDFSRPWYQGGIHAVFHEYIRRSERFESAHWRKCPRTEHFDLAHWRTQNH